MAVSALRRNIPLRPVNAKRRRRLWLRNFGAKAEFIRSLPCLACPYPNKAEAAHVRARGMGGCNGSSVHLVPLCRGHHRFLDDECGSPARFEEETGIDLMAEARRLEAEWQARSGA